MRERGSVSNFGSKVPRHAPSIRENRGCSEQGILPGLGDTGDFGAYQLNPAGTELHVARVHRA